MFSDTSLISSTEGAEDVGGLGQSRYEEYYEAHDWKNILSNLDGTGSDWTDIINQRYYNSIQNQNNQQYGASQYNSPGIIACAVLTLLSFLIGPILCACKLSKSKKAEGPIDPQANFVPMNQVEHTSELEQPHHQGHGRQTPYSVNQRWNSNSS